MNVIIDINVASGVLVKKEKRYECLMEKIERGLCKIVYGGKLLREYKKNRNVFRKILRDDQAGRAYNCSSKSVDQLAKQLKKEQSFKSNDQHIIALALVSRARLLVSADQDLHSDFKDRKLLDKPRGKVYQGKTHNRTLESYCRLCKKKS